MMVIKGPDKIMTYSRIYRSNDIGNGAFGEGRKKLFTIRPSKAAIKRVFKLKRSFSFRDNIIFPLLNRKRRTTATTRGGVGVVDDEFRADEIVFEFDGCAFEEGQGDIVRDNTIGKAQVFASRAFGEFHNVLKARASAAFNRDAQQQARLVFGCA